MEQLAFADRVLLNKIDLVSEQDLERVEKRIRGINAFAPILRTQQSNVSVESVLDLKAFDLTKTLEMDPEFLNTEGEHEHDDSVGSVSIQLPGEVHMLLVNEWIGDILKERGNDIYRPPRGAGRGVGTAGRRDPATVAAPRPRPRGSSASSPRSRARGRRRRARRTG